MKKRIQTALDDIRADDALLAKTADYLRAKRAKNGEEPRRRRPLRLVSALSATLALAVAVFGYRAYYHDAMSFVSIDVNPSIELTLNRADSVIAATAFNAEGEALLREASVNGRQYDEATAALIAQMGAQGYLRGDALVTMTVQTADGQREQALCDALLRAVDNQAGIDQATVAVEVIPVTREVRESASGCHMSAGKYLAIQELMEVDETATLEAYSESSIHQIRLRTRACSEEHESGESHDGGHGHRRNRNQGGKGHEGGQ